jgi:hypothetical protein
MGFTLLQPGTKPSLFAELVSLVGSPAEAYPLLIERDRMSETFTFAAASGVYVAYVAAERLHLGDMFGFGFAAVGVLFLGSALGLMAMMSAGVLLAWTAERLHGEGDVTRMLAVFSYATWPFLPLLCIIVPTELALYGTSLFSAVRPVPPRALPVLITMLEMATICLWLFLIVRGTALSATLSNRVAAKALALSLLEAFVIGVLLLTILVISFMI